MSKNTLFTITSFILALAMAPEMTQAAEQLICNGMADVRGMNVTLTLNGLNEVAVDQSLAVLDPNYNPRLNEGFLRYQYQDSEEGTSEVLVQAQLLEGYPRGLIKIQNRGEGFETTSYYCHP